MERNDAHCPLIAFIAHTLPTLNAFMLQFNSYWFAFNCRCEQQRMRNVLIWGVDAWMIHFLWFLWVPFRLLLIFFLSCLIGVISAAKKWRSWPSSLAFSLIFSHKWQWSHNSIYSTGKKREEYSFSALNCRHSSNCIRFGNLFIFPLLQCGSTRRDPTAMHKFWIVTHKCRPFVVCLSIALSSGPTFFRLYPFRNHNLYFYCRLPCIRSYRCVKWCRQWDDGRLCERAWVLSFHLLHFNKMWIDGDRKHLCVSVRARDEPPKQLQTLSSQNTTIEFNAHKLFNLLFIYYYCAYHNSNNRITADVAYTTSSRMERARLHWLHQLQL